MKVTENGKIGRKVQRLDVQRNWTMLRGPSISIFVIRINFLISSRYPSEFISCYIWLERGLRSSLVMNKIHIERNFTDGEKLAGWSTRKCEINEIEFKFRSRLYGERKFSSREFVSGRKYAFSYFPVGFDHPLVFHLSGLSISRLSRLIEILPYIRYAC